VLGGQLFAGDAELMAEVVAHTEDATPDRVTRGCRSVPNL
jgi:hypothetical protein